MSSNPADNVGIAFALVIAAGSATALGAGLVLFRGCVQLASTKLLAGCLGLSAGVMLYVSFGEIMIKSHAAFEEAGLATGTATAAATGTLFGGMLLVALLHGVLELINPSGDAIHDAPDIERLKAALEREDEEAASAVARDGASAEPGATAPLRRDSTAVRGASDAKDSGVEIVRTPEASEDGNADGNAKSAEGKDEEQPSTLSDRKLMRTGILAAISLAGHNFPEGAATFVGALADPAVGATLAIAIAIHNIPEGICVATTLYWATGSRWKAFLWAVLSGVAEPVGALIVWLALQGTLSPLAYAVIFGAVAGMMVYISLKELLPTARRYDPDDAVTSASTFAGMAIMAISLVLFVV